MRFLCKIGWHCEHWSEECPWEYLNVYHGKFKVHQIERTHYECCKCGYKWYTDKIRGR